MAYKPGDQFIIKVGEIKQVNFGSSYPCTPKQKPVTMYKMENMSCMFKGEDLNKLPMYSEDWDTHYKAGYQKGLEDVWEAMKKMVDNESNGGFSVRAMREIFGSVSLSKILNENTPSEAIEKIRIYEHFRDKIKVGDECVYKSNHTYPFVVTRIYYEENNGFFDGLYMDGSVAYDGTLELIEKTGKHYPEIAKLFDKTETMEGNK